MIQRMMQGETRKKPFLFVLALGFLILLFLCGTANAQKNCGNFTIDPSPDKIEDGKCFVSQQKDYVISWEKGWAEETLAFYDVDGFFDFENGTLNGITGSGYVGSTYLPPFLPGTEFILDPKTHEVEFKSGGYDLSYCESYRLIKKYTEELKEKALNAAGSESSYIGLMIQYAEKLGNGTKDDGIMRRLAAGSKDNQELWLSLGKQLALYDKCENVLSMIGTGKTKWFDFEGEAYILEAGKIINGRATTHDLELSGADFYLGVCEEHDPIRAFYGYLTSISESGDPSLEEDANKVESFLHTPIGQMDPEALFPQIANKELYFSMLKVINYADICDKLYVNSRTAKPMGLILKEGNQWTDSEIRYRIQDAEMEIERDDSTKTTLAKMTTGEGSILQVNGAASQGIIFKQGEIFLASSGAPGANLVNLYSDSMMRTEASGRNYIGICRSMADSEAEELKAALNEGAKINQNIFLDEKLSCEIGLSINIHT